MPSRTYAIQDVAAEVFGVSQATVSRSIEQIAPVVRQCIPIPAKIHDRAKRALTLEELEEILPGLRCLIDTSEQQVQRPKRKDTEKHYSGKAGRHTAKVQYAVNTNDLRHGLAGRFFRSLDELKAVITAILGREMGNRLKGYLVA